MKKITLALAIAAAATMTIVGYAAAAVLESRPRPRPRVGGHNQVRQLSERNHQRDEPGQLGPRPVVEELFGRALTCISSSVP